MHKRKKRQRPPRGGLLRKEQRKKWKSVNVAKDCLEPRSMLFPDWMSAAILLHVKEERVQLFYAQSWSYRLSEGETLGEAMKGVREAVLKVTLTWLLMRS